MNVNAALTNNKHPWVRMVLASAVVCVLLGYGAFTTFRLRVTYSNQRELNVLRDDLRDVRNQIDIMDRSFDERLGAIEQTVFGELQPKIWEQQHRPQSTEWSANRDRDLRERIRRLEQWRIETQYGR